MINKPPLKTGPEPWPTFHLVTIAMVAVAIVTAVALDFISSRRGERSYLFRSRGQRPPAVAEAKAPEEPAVKPETAPPAAEPKREPAPKEKEVSVPAKRRIRGQVALIVDDMGNSMEALGDIIGLREAVTVSILPFSSHAQETAQAAHDDNLEVLLHLPLESENGNGAATDTDGMIMAAMGTEEIVQAFEASLARVPFADGVNNHMGSKFTADGALMRTLLQPVKDKGLLFVDSRTTAKTVAYDEAVRMGIPAVERNVFLDADADRSRIKSRLIELFKLARKKGRAVGICHPYPETLEALKANFRLFADYDLEVVPVSKLVQK